MRVNQIRAGPAQQSPDLEKGARIMQGIYRLTKTGHAVTKDSQTRSFFSQKAVFVITAGQFDLTVLTQAINQVKDMHLSATALRTCNQIKNFHRGPV